MSRRSGTPSSNPSTSHDGNRNGGTIASAAGTAAHSTRSTAAAAITLDGAAGALLPRVPGMAVAGHLLRRADVRNAVGVDDDRRHCRRVHADLRLQHVQPRVEPVPYADHPVADLRIDRDGDLSCHRLPGCLLDRVPRWTAQVDA